MVIEFRLFNRILKKKKKEKNMKNLGKLLLGMLHTYYIKSHPIFVGDTFYDDLHLDVSRC